MSDQTTYFRDEAGSLLNSEESSRPGESENTQRLLDNGYDGAPFYGTNLRSRLLSTGFTTSVTLNILLLLSAAFYLFKHSATCELVSVKVGGSVSIPSITGLEFDKPTQYKHHTEFGWENLTLANERWEGLSTDPLIVALPDEWAETHGLPRSARWPWDATRGRYFIRAFHEMHCLKYIRRYVLDWQEGKGEVLVGRHTLHCLDSLRQSVMCRADDTLQITSDNASFAIGDQQYTMCRDWDKLIEWSQTLERHACHHSLDDYRTIKHSIERYAFCPDASPYKAIQEKYFQEHGHRNPWE